MNSNLKIYNVFQYNLRRIFILKRGYHKNTCNIGKRGTVLNKYVQSKDKRKHWHLNFTKTDKTKHIFEKVHKPSRRVTVLNALFIRNITDVLSTSDIAPEVLHYGIEITNIKVTSDFQIVNVFYSIPLNKLDSSEKIQTILAIKAPSLRAELISRNVLGKVPKLYFVRDQSNFQLLEFEKALASADLGPADESRIVPEETVVKDIFTFNSARVKKNAERLASKKINESKEISSPTPKIPADMKSNVLGLNHEVLMARVCVSKKQSKCVSDEAKVFKETDEKIDLFSQIPGISLQSANDRKKMLKKFCLDRKLMMKEKTKSKEIEAEDNNEVNNIEMFDNLLPDPNYEPDYYEEEEN